jgi:hypothetical protein
MSHIPGSLARRPNDAIFGREANPGAADAIGALAGARTLFAAYAHSRFWQILLQKSLMASAIDDSFVLT